MKKLTLFLLMLVLCVAMLMPGVSSTPVQAGDEGSSGGVLEKCLSADTLAILGIRHWNDMSAAFKKSPYYAAFNDPSVKKFLEGPIEKLREKMAEEAPEAAGLIKDFLKYPTGQIAVVIHSFTPPKPGEYEADGGVSFFIEVGENRGKVEGKFNELMAIAQSNAEEKGDFFGKRAIQHSGSTIYQVMRGATEEDAKSVYCCISDYVVFSSGLDYVKNIITHFGRGTSLPNSLDSDSQFKAAMATCGPDPQVYGYVNIKKLISMIPDTAEESELGMPDPLVVMDALGVKNVENAAFGISYRPTHTEFKMNLRTPGPHKGLFSLFNLVSTTPPKYIDDSISTYGSFGFNSAGLWDVIVDTVNSFGDQAAMGMQMGLGMLQQQFGVDVENDLFKSLGKKATIYSFIEKPYTATSMNSIFVFDLVDAEKMSSLIDTITALVTQNAGGAVNIEAVEYMGYTLYLTKASMPKFDEQGNFEMVEQDVVSLGVVDNSLVVSTTGGGLKKHVRNLKAENADSTLASNTDYQSMVSRFAPGDAVMLSYQDNKETLKYYDWFLKELIKGQNDEESAIPENPGFGIVFGALEEFGFDLSLLPSLEVFANTGRYAINTVKMTSDGFLMGAYSPYPTLSDR